VAAVLRCLTASTWSIINPLLITLKDNVFCINYTPCGTMSTILILERCSLYQNTQFP
jgi:hypothetical protein